MATKPADTKVTELPFGFQPDLADYQKYLLTFPHLQALAFRAALGQQREALAFWKRRCDEDLHLADRIAKAGELKDIYDAMLGFYEGASREYAAEASKLADLGSRMANDAVKGFHKEAEVLTQGKPEKVAA
jgi:hypothetical protein